MCVIAFASGIYSQVVCPVSPAFLVFITILFVGSTGIALKRNLKATTPILLLIAFIFAGMDRTIVSTLHGPPPPSDEPAIYDCVVEEASANTKIVKVVSAGIVHNLRTVLHTDLRLTIGDRLRVYGYMKELTQTFKNPSLISWRWLRQMDGIHYEIKGTVLSATVGNNYIEAWRRFLAKKIDDSGAQYGGILRALTIGDTTGLDNETKDLFLRTGTSHILAVSGSNTSIVTAFFFFIARVLMRCSVTMRLRGDDKKYAALLSIPFALFFMFTAGSGIPIIRATIMIVVYMLALYFERSRHVENALFFSALVILMLYPYSLFTPSFQLTFVSVLFIILFTRVAPVYAQRWHPVLKWLFSAAIITIAAMIGTLPVVLYHFHGINPFAVIHNMVAVPLMCVIATPMALTGVLIPYGDILLRLAGLVIAVTIDILHHIDMGYIYPVIRPSLFETICYALFVIMLLFLKNRLISCALIVLVAPLLLCYTMYAYQARFCGKALCLNFIDVGLGESILVEGPRGMRILIDGGGLYQNNYDIGRSVITPILLSKKITTLDYVINTHPHGDHTKGLLHIADNFHINHFVSGTHFSREVCFNELLKIVHDKQIPFEVWRRGDTFAFHNGVDIQVLNPPKESLSEDLNNNSLVLRLQFGKTTFLLTGDIDATVEETLILSHQPLSSRVLKIPHHGSRFSSSDYLLRVVNPSIAILSVGPGIKGIPSEETLRRYRDYSIPVLRTDINGLVRVCTDGNDISYSTYR